MLPRKPARLRALRGDLGEAAPDVSIVVCCGAGATPVEAHRRNETLVHQVVTGDSGPTRSQPKLVLGLRACSANRQLNRAARVASE